MLTHEQLKKKMLENSDVKRLYEQPDQDLKMLDEFLKARKKAKMTQEDVAKIMHTSRPSIARIESPADKHSPRLSTLRRYAAALGYELEIKLRKA